MANYDNWLLHYDELKEHIKLHHRLPQKTVVEGRSKLHWWKYQQKKRKAGLLTEEQMRLLYELELYRSRYQKVVIRVGSILEEEDLKVCSRLWSISGARLFRKLHASKARRMINGSVFFGNMAFLYYKCPKIALKV